MLLVSVVVMWTEKLDYNTIRQKWTHQNITKNTNVKKSMRSLKYSTDFQMKC